MKLRYPCANCGYSLKDPGVQCPQCGYQRNSTARPRRLVSVPGSLEQGVPEDQNRNDRYPHPHPHVETEFEDQETPASDGELPGRPRIPWIFLLLVLLPLVLNSYPEIVKNFKHLKETWRTLTSSAENASEPFSRVRVIAAGRAIGEGETITIDDLVVVSVPRENAPEHAIAPLNVDRLVGIRLERPIESGQILILDPCP